MPNVFRIGPYKFYFYSHDLREPPHIHVDRDKQSAKFWLTPVALAYNLGFRPHELRTIERLINKHRDTLLEGWNDNFDAETG